MSMMYRYGSFLDSLPMSRRHWTIFGVCAAGFVFDALDFQVMALAAPSIAAEWHIDPRTMGFVLSATVVGMLAGALLFGTISDRIGRRFGFQLTVAIFAVFCGASAFAQNVEHLAVLRFLTGLGIGGLVPIDTAIMSEFMPKSRRGALMALWALFFPVGGLIAAMAAHLLVPTLGWRSLFVVGVSPALLVLAIRLMIPESPRFLLGRGRIAEARKAIAWVAGDRPIPSGTEDASPAGEATHAGVTISTLFSPAYRHRTMMLWLVWFGWNSSYFGLLLWLPSLLVQHRGLSRADVFTFVMIFMISGIVGRIAVSFLIDRIGRRGSIALFGVFATVSMAVFSQQTGWDNLAVFGAVLAFFHDGGLSAVAPYTPELYPTRARATGVGYANGAGRVGAILSPIVVGYLITFGLDYVFAAFGFGYLLAAVTVLAFGIETRGMILEDAALELQASDRAVAAEAPDAVRAEA